MQKLVPLVPRERVNLQPYDTDYVHIPTTGQAVIDQVDTLNLPVTNSLNQGLLQHRNRGNNSWVEGQRTYDRTVRGLRKCTQRQVSREITIQR
jgi:hypothetical protein